MNQQTVLIAKKAITRVPVAPAITTPAAPEGFRPMTNTDAELLSIAIAAGETTDCLLTVRVPADQLSRRARAGRIIAVDAAAETDERVRVAVGSDVLTYAVAELLLAVPADVKPAAAPAAAVDQPALF